MFDGKVLLREDSLIFGGKVFIEGGFLNIWGQGLIEGRFIINMNKCLEQVMEGFSRDARTSKMKMFARHWTELEVTQQLYNRGNPTAYFPYAK